MGENYARELHALMRCRTLQSLMDAGKSLTGNPFVLGDLALHVVAMTGDNSITDPRWEQIRREMTLPRDMAHMDLYRSSLRADAPVVATVASGLPVIYQAVSQDGKLMGYLLSPCYGEVPGQEMLELIRVLGDLCAIRLRKDHNYGEYPENVPEFFAASLLNGTITDPQVIEDRCRAFGWNLRMPYRVLNIRPRGDNTGETARIHVRQTLRRQFPDATVFLYGDVVKLIVPVHDRTTRDALVLRELEKLLGEEGCVAGVSPTSGQLGHISLRHQQAVKALELGTVLQGAGPLYFYDNYSVYHCLELCAPQIELPRLCHSAVLKLESYDRKNGTELLGTLHAYLSCHKNLSEAAAFLYVHRNTLTKRLERINDLIHVDLDDAETVFHLMFSYRLIEYYGATVLRNSYENWMERAPTLRHP